MIGLDAADLVVIASEVLGCDTGTALARADIAAADDALAEAGPTGQAGAPKTGGQTRRPLRRRAGGGRLRATPPKPRSP